MRSHSLLRKVFLRLVIVTAVTMVAVIGLLFWQFQRATGELIDSDLPDLLASVSKHIRLDADGRPVPDLPPDFPYEFDEERFVIVSDSEGNAYFSIPAGHEKVYHPFSSEQTDRPQFFEHRYIDSTMTYLGATQHMVMDGTDYWVQVVDDVPYWRTLSYYSIALFGEGLGVLVVLHLIAAGSLCYLAVRGTMVPVQRAADEARKIRPGQEHLRIGTTDLPDEVRPLADAANAALDRLQKALDAQKRFTADAAHEILTPLAVIRAQAENLEDRERSKALLVEIDEMSEMAMQLLELAELDSMETTPTDSVDLRGVAEEVMAKFAAQAIEHGIEPHLHAPDQPVIVPGCSKGIRSAIGNLVKNAIDHADGARNIEIKVEAPGSVRVIDDGPGIPESRRTQIFERFHHFDPANHGNRGLGLAIVKRVVENHGGSVAVSDGPGGKGAEFVMTFPDRAVPAHGGDA